MNPTFLSGLINAMQKDEDEEKEDVAATCSQSKLINQDPLTARNYSTCN